RTAPSARLSREKRVSGTAENKSVVNRKRASLQAGSLQARPSIEPHFKRASFGVVKDHAHGVTMTRPDSADAVTHIDAVEAACSLRRPDMYGKGHGIALAKRHDLGSRLHARPLLGQYELATGKIPFWFRQQDRHLEREHMLAVQILVQAVIVASFVLQQKRRRFCLAGVVTSPQEGLVAFRIADFDPHRLVP